VAYVVAHQNDMLVQQQVSFSLFYFGAGTAVKIRTGLSGSGKYADQHGFEAIWTPERHFHEVGGLYPNPAVLSAPLSMVTKRIQLRSGSVCYRCTIRCAWPKNGQWWTICPVDWVGVSWPQVGIHATLCSHRALCRTQAHMAHGIATGAGAMAR